MALNLRPTKTAVGSSLTLRVSDGGPMTLASPETLTRRSLDPVVGRRINDKRT